MAGVIIDKRLPQWRDVSAWEVLCLPLLWWQQDHRLAGLKPTTLSLQPHACCFPCPTSQVKSHELRFSAGDPSRWPGFAADLVDRKVNVIMGASTAAKAAQIATATIPIVAMANDVEEAGLVTSEDETLCGPGRR
jgi:hypothetical protein